MFATGEDTCKAKWRFIQFILLGNFADFEGGFVWILDETSGQGHYPFTSLLTHQNPEAGKSVFPVHWSRGVLFNFFSSHLSPPYFRNLCDILLSLSSHLPPFAIISLILYQFSEADKRPSCTFVLETSCGKEGVFRVRNQESNLGEIFSMFQKSRSRVVNTLCIKCTFLVQGVFICFGFIACMSCLIINAF